MGPSTAPAGRPDLIELARRAAPAYAATGNVVAVVAAGSVGRGHADAYSDLELDVYWARPPSDDERLAPITALGGRLDELWPYEPAEAEWAENYQVDGCDVGVSGYLAEWLTGCIDDVVLRADPDNLKQMRLAALNEGMAVFGEDAVAGWRSRSGEYPDELAVAVATDYLDPARLGRWPQRRALVHRGDTVLLRACLPPVTEMVLGALCAVNRVLIPHPAFKWSARIVERCPVAPADLPARLSAVADLPAVEATQVLDELLADVVDLVAGELPEVPLDGLRAALAGGRRPAAS